MEIAAITAFLAPFLARLLKPAQDAAGDAAERFGEKGLAYAQQIWGRLSGRVEEKPAALEAAKDVAAEPEDEEARSALAWQLRKLLQEDPGLAEDVASVWQQVRDDPAVTVNVTASGERSVAVGRDLTGQVSTGDAVPRDERA